MLLLLKMGPGQSYITTSGHYTFKQGCYNLIAGKAGKPG